MRRSNGPLYINSHSFDVTAIDESIVNIDFLRSDTNQLYGLARNQISLMRSDDWGENWDTVTEEEYTSASSGAQVIAVRRLPFGDWSATSLGDLNTQFGFDLNSTVRWTGASSAAILYFSDSYTYSIH